MTISALIADDEPRLRDELAELLAGAWPGLRIVALARNGREAVEQFESLRPSVCFLDVHMPGMSGVEAAHHIGRRAHLVFVTAFEQYAVQAFAQGALDYLVKPVQPARLADTVSRLRERIDCAAPAQHNEDLLRQLAQQLQRSGRPPGLRWLRAQVGAALRLIPVDRVDYLQADNKYTVVAWRNDEGAVSEAVVSVPLKDLLAQLDPDQFVQVHRSAIVNLGSISHVVRGVNETADIHLKGRTEVLRASRSFTHHFKQM
ncbi:MAG: response regulator transcription factor [Piscinibacter sp.]|uniref:LytR/AlgR family response regulator transcription factor n=1 Tax=Piscinibacter sp. TaxID=1903157 RepID=UPI001B7C5277|nr:LytTR family DNA-binding domain-containing protein [Piscinibacter sp.]MBP5991722.1 response regulator transcription factor [Piscinibacter sp.]MBP6029066.1 response regulator transcription factor [Piscinibacter sp.]